MQSTNDLHRELRDAVSGLRTIGTALATVALIVAMPFGNELRADARGAARV